MTGPDNLAQGKHDCERLIRRHRHRWRAQRPGQRRLPGSRRQKGPGTGAPSRCGRRCGHRGDHSRLQVLGLLLRRLAAAAGDHPRPRPASSRAGNSSARRHLHAHAKWRLPVARERSRQDRARDATPLQVRRRGLRGIRQSHAADVPLREADSRHGASRSDHAQPEGPAQADVPRPPLQGPERRRQVQPGAAHDHERYRLPRSVVRDRCAQGHHVGIRNYRHISWRAVARHRLRSAAPLHGGD